MSPISEARSGRAHALWGFGLPRLMVALLVLGPLLIPGQLRHASAATLTVTPKLVHNMAKATLAMSGSSAAYERLATAGHAVIEVSGPTEGTSQTYTGSNVRFEDGLIKADVALATGTLGAGPGTYSVRLCAVKCTNSPAPPSPADDTGSFTVFAQPVSVTTATPTVVALNGTTNVTLTGNFARGATVQAEPPVAAGTVTVIDGEHVRVPLTTTAATPPGHYSLTVRNTDGTRDVCYRCIRVADFQMKSVSPTMALNTPGWTRITATGENFPPETQLVGALAPLPVIIGQDPITSYGSAAMSGTSWTGSFDLADAAPGPYQLTVTSEDGTVVGACACLFEVKVQAPPTISGLAPPSVGQAARELPLTVLGTHFPRGAVLTTPEASKVTLGSTEWVDNRTLTTTATVDPEAAVGKVSVTVTNPSGAGTFVCTGCLVVNPRPVISSAAPDTVTQGDREVAVTLTGDNFNRDTRLTFAPGVTVRSATYVDPKKMSLVLDIDGAARGLKTATAENLDGGMSGAVSILQVRRIVLATLAANHPAVSAGTPVVLSGKISYRDNGAPAAGQTASLTYATTGAAQPLADVTTDNNGSWTFKHEPKQNTTYRLAVAAVGGVPTTSAPFKVGVSPEITITSPAPNSTSSAGAPLTVTGTLMPAVRTPITVFAKDGRGRIRAHVRVMPDSQGRFKTRVPLMAGKYWLWAVSDATATHVAGTSAPRLIQRR